MILCLSSLKCGKMNKLVDENFSTQIQRSKMRTHFWKPFLASSNFARFCLKKMYFANLGNLKKWAMVRWWRGWRGGALVSNAKTTLEHQIKCFQLRRKKKLIPILYLKGHLWSPKQYSNVYRATICSSLSNRWTLNVSLIQRKITLRLILLVLIG